MIFNFIYINKLSSTLLKISTLVNYMDEEDGVARLSFSIDDNRVESWSLNQHLGADGPEKKALTAHTLGNL